MQDGEGQTTEHLCTIPGCGQQGGVNFGRGEGGAGWGWGEGEKAGTTVIV